MPGKSKAMMNKELQEWIQKSQDKIKKAEGEQKKLKPHGMCQICGEKKAKFVCIKCGRNVCSSCYFKIIGVCKKCVQHDVAGKWDGSHPDWEKELGVEWVG